MTASLYQSGSFMRWLFRFSSSVPRQGSAYNRRMLTLLALMLALAAAEPQATGNIIRADEIAATLKHSIANNPVDQPIKLAEVPGGHKASVALLRRTKPETSALI